MDRIRRRTFNRAALGALALPLIGCGGGESGGDAAARDTRANLAEEPFLAGAPSDYREPGVYDRLKPEKGVWLVSDGTTLVAFSATCTHRGCTTDWEPDTQTFVCPCHESHFTTDGMQTEASKATRPLERCAISVVETDDGPRVRIDPTTILRKERGGWDEPTAALDLD